MKTQNIILHALIPRHRRQHRLHGVSMLGKASNREMGNKNASLLLRRDNAFDKQVQNTAAHELRTTFT